MNTIKTVNTYQPKWRILNQITDKLCGLFDPFTEMRPPAGRQTRPSRVQHASVAGFCGSSNTDNWWRSEMTSFSTAVGWWRQWRSLPVWRMPPSLLTEEYSWLPLRLTAAGWHLPPGPPPTVRWCRSFPDWSAAAPGYRPAPALALWLPPQRWP